MLCTNTLQNLRYLYKKLVINSFCKSRHYWKNMDCIDLHPPNCVNGMTNLDRNLFKKVIKIPQLRIPQGKFNEVLPFLKIDFLKMEKLKPVSSNDDNPDEKIILLHPKIITWENLSKKEELCKKNITKQCFQYGEIELKYENWKADEIFKAVMPKDNETLTSFSKIGHILHVNLRNHLMPYKTLIGEVLIDKIPGCKTVVNKSQSIDNTYRNFSLELMFGEENYVTETKENGITFQFDFSKVYWNPRLSTEHERIIKMLNNGDIFYDVFAGVGPFSIPAAKKKCLVLANDLNPDSYFWLKTNITKNKCDGNVEAFNKDGEDFILNIMKRDILKKLEECDNIETRKIHIAMNLPAKAVEFLGNFKGLLKDKPEFKAKDFNLPLVHVYCFIKGEKSENLILHFVEENAGYNIKDSLEGIYFVRNVAPNKDMYRISFYLTKDILFEETATKKRKHLISDELIEEKKNCVKTQENK